METKASNDTSLASSTRCSKKSTLFDIGLCPLGVLRNGASDYTLNHSLDGYDYLAPIGGNTRRRGMIYMQSRWVASMAERVAYAQMRLSLMAKVQTG